MSLKDLLTKLNPFAKKVEPQVEVILPEAPPPIETEEQEPVESESEEESLPEKKKVKLTHRVSEQDKQYMVTMLATGLTPTEIVERAKQELGIDVSTHVVYMYGRSEKWQPLIRKIRQEVMTDLASVAGSHKKVRLERAEKVYDKAIGRGRLDVALKATEHQRKEMEEQSGSINLTLNQFNVLSDEELQLKQREVMDKIQKLSQKKGITLEQSTDQTETTRP